MSPRPPQPDQPSAPHLAPSGLPIDAAATALTSAVTPGGSAVIVAEPGAGKSTVVPLWLDALLPGRIVVLEPRRLAARATATRLAERAGEPVGGRVGLTMRGERRVSPQTTVEVITEAVLTRRLQEDPSLEGTAAVVFDEFHERSLHADLGLALTLEARHALRPDLVVVVMSATIDAEPLARHLGGAPVIRVAGRTHPVTTTHLPRPVPAAWAAAVADATRTALAETIGDVLVFLPGRGEIAAVGQRLGTPPGVEVHVLHGGGSRTDHHHLLDPRHPGGRRIVLATAVAETSVTLPGITAVVDGGRSRQPRYDPRTGLGRLETVGVTRFSADQRRGRAGRTGPGHCYRLWPADEDHHLAAATEPEVLAGDLEPLALELARWGDPAGRGLPWLDPPSPDRLATARRTLAMLGLTTGDGRLTPAGQTAARLPLHPRGAALVLAGQHHGQGRLAAVVAVLLDQRTSRPQRPDIDLRAAVEASARDRAAQREIERLARRARLDLAGPVDADQVGPLLARAWPDRIARRREAAPDRYRLAGGGEVRLPNASPLAGRELLVIADAGGLKEPPTVSLAVPLDRAELLRAAAAHLTWTDEVRWDDRRGQVEASRHRRLGTLVLHREPHPDPDPAAVARAVVDGIGRRGLELLHWSEPARQLRDRVAFARRHGEPLPDLDDEALLARLDHWLLPAVAAAGPVPVLADLDVAPLLRAMLDWPARRRLDEFAPAELAPPRGRSRPVTYADGQPRWSVRIQDLIGLDRHPTVADGRVPVVIELLSPAGRPAQVTADLPGFWRRSYQQVRAELRGRYPKHPWPDEPWLPLPASRSGPRPARGAGPRR